VHAREDKEERAKWENDELVDADADAHDDDEEKKELALLSFLKNSLCVI
jgi:hypothetical protein